MPATDDEIREKYLERAIRELNQLTREIQDCDHCPRGNLMPVLGSGHPQADIFMLKFAPRPSEIEEGVAFYGRAGSALMKSFKRLGIDPLAVYGTVFVKCPVADTDLSAPECRARVLDELAVVQPRIVVVMGEEALRGAERARRPAGGVRGSPRPGEIQKLTPSCDALYVPDIDASLDDESAKRSFWKAFRSLGEWYATSRRTSICPVPMADTGNTSWWSRTARRSPTSCSPRCSERAEARPPASRCWCPPRRTAWPGRPTCTRAARRRRPTWTRRSSAYARPGSR